MQQKTNKTLELCHSLQRYHCLFYQVLPSWEKVTQLGSKALCHMTLRLQSRHGSVQHLSMTLAIISTFCVFGVLVNTFHCSQIFSVLKEIKPGIIIGGQIAVWSRASNLWAFMLSRRSMVRI